MVLLVQQLLKSASKRVRGYPGYLCSQVPSQASRKPLEIDAGMAKIERVYGSSIPATVARNEVGKRNCTLLRLLPVGMSQEVVHSCLKTTRVTDFIRQNIFSLLDKRVGGTLEPARLLCRRPESQLYLLRYKQIYIFVGLQAYPLQSMQGRQL